MPAQKSVKLAFTALAIITLNACGQNAGGDRALKTVAEDPEYLAAVKERAETITFKDKSEQQAFDIAMAQDTHPTYVAFLELYPETDHRTAVEQRLQRFRLFSAKEQTFVGEEQLAQMCWPTRGYMGHWRDGGLVGMMTGGPRTYFGPMMIYSETGSIQLIAGSYVEADGGYDISGGTKLIYSTKCHEGAE